MKNILNILTFFLLTNLCLGQTDITFSIKQVSFPSGHYSNYEFDGKILIATENGQKIEKRELNQAEIKQIDSVIKEIRLDTLKENYSRPVYDGVHTTFSFYINGTKKEIRLNNYYLVNLDILVRLVNDYLKEKNRIISFGEDMLSRPDTVVYYLPDFYVDTFKIPENYNFYRIMCFRKGYFITEILDSIELCDCRIYPTNKNSSFKKRHYWRAFRVDNNSWNREYFDNENKVFKTEYVEDILPYEIVKETVRIDFGDKPSVEIYRYYKTMIKKE